MRAVHAICLLACLAAMSLQPAVAQTDCASDTAKLGVSRTVVIDASTGPKFGSKFNETNFLADGEVVLSFDDGPMRPHTKSILDTLAAHCTKATFFLVGRMAMTDPHMVKEIARLGHTVATHTWSHANLQKATPLEGQVEIELGISAVRFALGKPVTPFFRFPFLRHTDSTVAHLQERKFAAIGIDVDSRDFETKDMAAVSERVLSELALRRKGIILMHDIHAWTAGALPTLLTELKERGFRVVHLKAKQAAQTVPHYDALVQQEAERLRQAALAQPGKRSTVRPTAAFSEADADPAAKVIPEVARPATRKRVSDDLPAANVSPR